VVRTPLSSSPLLPPCVTTVARIGDSLGALGRTPAAPPSRGCFARRSSPSGRRQTFGRLIRFELVRSKGGTCGAALGFGSRIEGRDEIGIEQDMDR
jgi:hypothetical protein